MNDSIQIDSLQNVIDSLINIKQVYFGTKPVQYVNWSPWVLLVATLSLISAVLIPFLQKVYIQRKTKSSFKIYIKNQLGSIFNLLTGEKIEYVEPSVKNEIKKELFDIENVCNKIIEDFNKNKSTVQPRIIFSMILNIQNLLHFVYKLRHSTATINFEKIIDKTLDHGKNMSDDELKNIYGLLLILKSYCSITAFHDKFGNLKSLKRDYKESIWVGHVMDKDFIEKQSLLNEDLLFLNDNEISLIEIIEILKISKRETLKYFNE